MEPPMPEQGSAHYVLILKANQPLALQAAQALLSGTDTEFADAMTVEEDRGHGRTERCTLRVAPAGDSLFPGARQVFRLRRDTGGLDGQRTHKEIVYGIISLPAGLASPTHLNHYERGHWCVANRLHWTRDVTFHEDNFQLRTGSAPRALAAFRNLAIGTYRLAGRASIAHARRDLHDRADVSPSTVSNKPSPNRTKENNAGAVGAVLVARAVGLSRHTRP
jgi:hypothetical protein